MFMGKIEMVIDSINVALINYQRAIILKEKEGQRYLPMWVGAAEADAILTGLQNAPVSEPLTHDFVCSIISNLGAVLKYVNIYELRGETYYAKAFLKRESEIIEIDCRPSDAFATALRAGVPICVAEEILIKSGITLDETNKLIEGKEER